tara:strand:+ start:123 stop:653 length:531 start_codon:yes stop_codon:yes gene_type:complete
MAGQRLTDKTALEEQLGSGDLLMVVDVNDTTSSAEGTSKKYDAKFLMQTDKISVSNAEVQDLSSNEKVLVGALSGYMVTVFNVTCLVTYASAAESSNASLYFGYDDSDDNKYWDGMGRMMHAASTNRTYNFSGDVSASGAYDGSIINKPFVIWSSAAFNGGWSMDVYVTYCYTKVL